MYIKDQHNDSLFNHCYHHGISKRNPISIHYSKSPCKNDKYPNNDLYLFECSICQQLLCLLVCFLSKLYQSVTSTFNFDNSSANVIIIKFPNLNIFLSIFKGISVITLFHCLLLNGRRGSVECCLSLGST